MAWQIRIAALIVLSPLVASAGALLETVERDVATGTTSPSNKVYVQSGMARIEDADGGVIIFKDDVMYQIDTEDRTYHVLDKATMEQMASGIGAAMVKMQEQMAQMSPQQRAQMEQMMGKMGMSGMPGMSRQPDRYEAVDTGRSDNAAGRSCRVWNIKRNGTVEDELCVVPYSSLPGKAELQALMRRMGTMFESLADKMPGMDLDGMARAYTRIDGYPVRQRDIVNGKPAGTESLLKTAQEHALPATMFAVPAGYKRAELPKMGAAMGGGG